VLVWRCRPSRGIAVIKGLMGRLDAADRIDLMKKRLILIFALGFSTKVEITDVVGTWCWDGCGENQISQ